MKTYLLTWNPKQWRWDDITKRASETASGKVVSERWSCGVAKKIEVGGRVFLVRLGSEPRGIVGSGLVKSEPYQDSHWDEQRASAGDKALYVDCDWDCLLEEAFCLPYSELINESRGKFKWMPPAGGIRIPADIAAKLEVLWSAHIGILKIGELDRDYELSSVEGESRMALVRHRRRERVLRDAKIREALKGHNGSLNCEVPNCGFDFHEIYGDIGFEFAHVHHLEPLGDRNIPSATKLSDLAIVCANCHAMIHRNGACRPLESLVQRKRK